MYDFITRDDRPTQNVTEWCKREQCWKNAQRENWSILPEFIDTLIPIEGAKDEEKSALKDQKVKNEVEDFKFVWGAGKEYWEKVLEWGNENKLLYHAEQDYLKTIINMYETGHTPTEKQIRIILKARERLIKEGMNID